MEIANKCVLPLASAFQILFWLLLWNLSAAEMSSMKSTSGKLLGLRKVPGKC